MSEEGNTESTTTESTDTKEAPEAKPEQSSVDPQSVAAMISEHINESVSEGVKNQMKDVRADVKKEVTESLITALGGGKEEKKTLHPEAESMLRDPEGYREERKEEATNAVLQRIAIRDATNAVLAEAEAEYPGITKLMHEVNADFMREGGDTKKVDAPDILKQSIHKTAERLGIAKATQEEKESKDMAIPRGAHVQTLANGRVSNVFNPAQAEQDAHDYMAARRAAFSKRRESN